MTGIEDSTKALGFMKAAAPEMSNGNMDGIGYSAINSKNELFMEKWHNNRSFLDSDNVIDEKTLVELAAYKQKLGLELNYMSYGNITRGDLKTVTMHTRFATCGRTMENTHPFVYNETSLIHNGIINNDRQLNNKKISTCDSESALQLYLSKECALGGKSVYQSFLDELRGYWAFGILAKSSEGKYMLDVIKGGAQLYFAYIPEMGDDCIVFATSKEIINVATKEMGFKTPKISDLIDNSLNKFDALTGKLIATTEFKAKKVGWYYEETKEVEKGLATTFLNQETKTELVTYDKNFAYVDKFSESEMEIFDADTQSIEQTIADYDDYLGSNYVIFYNKLPQGLKSDIEFRKNRGLIKFGDILKVIEEYNNVGGNFGKAWSMLVKLSA